MIKYEPQGNLIKVYSDKDFYIQYKGNYYDFVILNNLDNLENITETDIAMPSIFINKEQFIQTFIPDFPQLTQERIETAHNELLNILNSLDNERAYKMFFLYKTWHRNNKYKGGEIIYFERNLYRVINSHTSNLFPSQDTTNYKKLDKPNSFIEDWSSLNMPYQLGDKVKVGKYIYQSTLENNIWTPVDFPAGWILIEGSQA